MRSDGIGEIRRKALFKKNRNDGEGGSHREKDFPVRLIQYTEQDAGG